MNKDKYIVCIDSDGCALDTMNYKHLNYFGPIAVEVFNVADKDIFLEYWNNINLYSNTRGCNRFIGLYKTFEKLHDSNTNYKKLDDLKKWALSTNELSNDSLKVEIKKTNSEVLKKVLEWSEKVNSCIKDKKEPPKIFDGVYEAFKYMKKLDNVDIAIVSAANLSALKKEWDEVELLQYVKLVFSQENGSKKQCLKKIIDDYGYRKEQILMIGDSPGDYQSAYDNQIKFFPILFGKEKEYWGLLKNKYLMKFLNNDFKEKDQQQLLDLYNKNFI